MPAHSGRVVPESVADKLYGAADLIAANGLENTRIDQIAKAAGIPRATLYYHFTGKEEILAFLLRHSLAALADEVAEAAAAPGTGRERLAAVIQVQIEHTMRRPGVSRALVGDLGRAIRLPELAAAVQQAFYDPITSVLTVGAEDGSLRTFPSPESVAVSVFGAIMMSAMLHNVVGSAKSEEAVAAEVIDLLMTGAGSGQA
ncbi:TetR/AcrR family transcriptional regulator [Mycolicibacterium sp. S2-37]|uniref:TetR/AcrR family transcriptional regulator n=1 Tax=Mycolicibacterium sp. S2-37 TaxID=2810297 RepID=UPI001A94D1F7|nr:TetR/AcrR family transcriptional regulator [Mycolicibacterium sp. S2-37]MBO0680134.1 TetR/AcrR family transcriptional regulator [Mycolicibacterium sp. S2-37]